MGELIHYNWEQDEQLTQGEQEAELSRRVYDGLRAHYAEAPAREILRRVERELFFAELFELSADFLAVHDFALFLRKKHIPYLACGPAASSLLLFLLGVSFSNPLPPHYFCPQCKSLVWDSSHQDGFDLPERVCACGVTYARDGHDIPLETYWGLELDAKNLSETQHELGLVIPKAAFPSANDFFMSYRQLAGLELKRRIGYPLALWVGHIFVGTATFLPENKGSAWFGAFQPDAVRQAAIAHLAANDKEFFKESGYRVDTFHSAVKATGFIRGMIWCEWDGAGRLIIGGKPVPADDVPAHFDDLLGFLEDKAIMKDVLRQRGRLLSGKGFAPNITALLDEGWLCEYVANTRCVFPKGDSVELLIARAKRCILEG